MTYRYPLDEVCQSRRKKKFLNSYRTGQVEPFCCVLAVHLISGHGTWFGLQSTKATPWEKYTRQSRDCGTNLAGTFNLAGLQVDWKTP